MDTKSNDNREATEAKSPTPLTHRDVIRLLARDVPRAGATPVFFKKGLERIMSSLGGIVGALEIRLPSGACEHTHGIEGADVAFWEPTLQSLLTKTLMEPRTRARLLEGHGGSMKVALLAAPFLDGADTPMGAISVVVPCRDEAAARPLIARLESLATLAAVGAAGIVTASLDQEGDGAAVGVLSRAGKFESVTQMAFTLTNNLRNKSGCEYVALGLVKGRHADIISISGQDDAKGKNPGVARMGAAMAECIDACEVIVSQNGGPEDDPLASDYRLHSKWRDASSAAVASMPFVVEGRLVAVMSLARRESRPFAPTELAEYHEQIQPYIGALDVIHRATRGVASHAVASARSGIRKTLRPEKWLAKLVLLAFLGGVAWFFTGTLRHKITVPAIVVSNDVRQFAAPADGILTTAPHALGDRVAEGDVLCAFDTHALELEVRRLETEIAVAEIEARKALASSNPVDAQLAQAHVDHLESQKAIVARRVEEAVVRAPFDGIVLRGDLRGRTGDRFARGQELLTLTPLSGWSLEIDLPEADVADMERTVRGTFLSNARPEEEHEFEIERIRPDAEQKDGKVVFVAEAPVAIADDWVREGMEGVARIDIGPRRPWRVVLRGAIDWLRMNFYF